ncbi:DUF309 domain-containing protein [Novipirellula sp. SH528]|uniref:DUF309 domain-containing protein n=1 Tax=Novipirellula sp. SH528 TaxID=3454466 RepID=UPI003FA0E652
MHPHPVSGVGGHRYEHGGDDGQDPQSIFRPHCLAIDLVNYGYYWESHEAWEMIWIAAPAATTRARFLKGLIKLAAAGVKARQGSATGVRRHAARAAALFIACEQDTTFDGRHELGLKTMSLYQSCTQLAERADSIVDSTVCRVRRVLPFVLDPDFDSDNLRM